MLGGESAKAHNYMRCCASRQQALSTRKGTFLAKRSVGKEEGAVLDAWGGMYLYAVGGVGHARVVFPDVVLVFVSQ